MSNSIIPIHEENGNFPVNGRELHEVLCVETPYHKWFPRMVEYGFEAGKDFQEVSDKIVQNPLGGRPATNHSLTLSMAKEICMLQRTEQGREVRRYLIKVEEAWNEPEKVMARALQIANQTLAKFHDDIMALEAKNEEMRPKAEYFDALVDRNLLTNFRETAKQLHTKQNQFVRFLMDSGYVYRDNRGRLMPYAQHAENGLFEVKECLNGQSQWCGTQTLVTPKGRETFRLLLKQ